MVQWYVYCGKDLSGHKCINSCTLLALHHNEMSLSLVVSALACTNADLLNGSALSGLSCAVNVTVMFYRSLTHALLYVYIT